MLVDRLRPVCRQILECFSLLHGLMLPVLIVQRRMHMIDCTAFRREYVLVKVRVYVF